jgi:NAD(P)-dependent dehydrogenase (short-subunit alcohol dehydrogenase family)
MQLTQLQNMVRHCHFSFSLSSALTIFFLAVIGLSRTAAKEVGDREIRVNCISPGIIDTPMHRASLTTRAENPMPPRWQIARKGQAYEVAALIAWLLCDSSSYITGSVQMIDGGWTC